MIHAAGLILFRRSAISTIEYLLLEHTKGGFWTPPKGHNDPGESDRDAAVRETEEETGLKSTDYRILPGFCRETKYMVKKGEKTVVYFLAELTTSEPQIRLSTEHTDFAWLPLEHACGLISVEHLVTREVLRKAAEFLERSGQ